MKKIFSLILVILISVSAYGDTIQGGVSERGTATSSRIVDKETGKGRAVLKYRYQKKGTGQKLINTDISN